LHKKLQKHNKPGSYNKRRKPRNFESLRRLKKPLKLRRRKKQLKPLLEIQIYDGLRSPLFKFAI
jgi:hypothetical protein